MAVTTTIVLKSDHAREIRTGSPKNTQMDIARIVDSLMVSDVSSFEVFANATAGVKASGTLTVDAGNLQADDTVTVGVTVLTAKVSPSGIAQFAVGGSATISATNMAACINAHTTLSQFVTASSSGRIVTITAKVAGVVGNLIAIAASDASVVASAAALANGAGATDVSAISWSL